jgi:hypothetical protein
VEMRKSVSEHVVWLVKSVCFIPRGYAQAAFQEMIQLPH